MNSRDKLRRLKHLMHKHDFFFSLSNEKAEENLNWFKTNSSHNKRPMEALIELLDIYKLSDELNIKDMKDMWLEISIQKASSKRIREMKPQKESRDNKGVYVGSRGSNRNKIRYPSKKRSMRVWRTFYKMFPWAAEADGWDGKTSRRIKK